MLYYRTDAFLARSLAVPNTWDELLLAVIALNGTDFSGDGVGDFAACFQVFDNCADSGALLAQILAPYTQYQVRCSSSRLP